MQPKPLPPIEVLREVLTYNPHTGELRWSNNAPRNRGRVAGRVNAGGYRELRLGGRCYRGSRVAYAMHHGIDPYPLQIDHINRIRDDDRIDNLRVCTPSENCYNRDCTNVHRPYGNKNNIRPIIITFPDERGTVIVSSMGDAQRLLNTSRTQIHRLLRRPSPRTGITCAYHTVGELPRE